MNARMEEASATCAAFRPRTGSHLARIEGMPLPVPVSR